MIQLITSNSAMRKTRASARPSRRARSACSLGSRATSTEMNTMLSMPSTTSITVSVAKAAHTAGSDNNSIIDKLHWRCGLQSRLRTGGLEVSAEAISSHPDCSATERRGINALAVRWLGVRPDARLRGIALESSYGTFLPHFGQHRGRPDRAFG